MDVAYPIGQDSFNFVSKTKTSAYSSDLLDIVSNLINANKSTIQRRMRLTPPNAL
jgi:hypothetical protein